MKDFVIHKISWHLQGDPRGQEVVAELVRAYKPLIAWLGQQGLFSSAEFAKKPLDENFEIRLSDLTEAGFKLFKLSHNRWLKSLD